MEFFEYLGSSDTCGRVVVSQATGLTPSAASIRNFAERSTIIAMFFVNRMGRARRVHKKGAIIDDGGVVARGKAARGRSERSV